MTKWDGKIFKLLVEADSLIWRLSNGGNWMATATDSPDPTPEIKKVLEATRKLNRLAKYAIESGRISPAKAAEVMGEGTKEEDITEP